MPDRCSHLSLRGFDGLVKSQKVSVIVIPVKTGIQENQSRRGGRLPLPDQVEDKLRGSNGLGEFLQIHQFSKAKKSMLDCKIVDIRQLRKEV